MAIGRSAYPPEEMTPSEEAATVGRYQESAEPDTAPYIEDRHLKPGRIAPAPRGTFFVRDPDEARADSIRDAVARFEAVGEDVPEHLAGLAAGLGANKEPELTPAKEAAQAAGVGKSTPEATLEEVDEQVDEVDEQVDEDVDEEADEEDLESYTVAELKAELDALGVEYPSGAHKADLIELLAAQE